MGKKGGGRKKERKERYERERKEGGRQKPGPAWALALPGCLQESGWAGGLCDKVKVKLASYLIWKVPVLHFSLSFCQDLVNTEFFGVLRKGTPLLPLLGVSSAG